MVCLHSAETVPSMRYAMPRNLSYCVFCMLLACVSSAGCGDLEDSSSQDESYSPPVHQAGTVSEYARLNAGATVYVRGWGLVVGLGDNGSRQIPAHLGKYFRKYLYRKNMPISRESGMGPTITRLLRSRDTAIVEIVGVIPPGAPVGERFPVTVRARSLDVKSLEGGMLMPSELRRAVGGITDPEAAGFVLAVAGGEVFVNPFIDDKNPVASAAQLRKGRIIGGGVFVDKRRKIRLELLRPDYARANMMQKRIESRFSTEGGVKVANAVNSSRIDITVPGKWKRDYFHFLELVNHLTLRTGSGRWEKQASDVAKAMLLPGANHNQLALVWEAMGRQAVPIAARHYASPNKYASYYSARTGLRLGDLAGAPEVVLRVAETEGHPLQLRAIKELGSHKRLRRASLVLRSLLSSSNEQVRVASYKSLLHLGSRGAVTSIPLRDGVFRLNLVPCKGPPAIYASQVVRPEIALFGRQIKINQPMFFSSPGGIVTINSNKETGKLTIIRRLRRKDSPMSKVQVSPDVASLVIMLGGKPDLDKNGNLTGLGLTYGEVVGVLYRMCEQKSIPATFVLEKATEVQGTPRGRRIGRPNMAGS